MKVGIEKLGLYAGRLVADAQAIAAARGVDTEQLRRQVMVEARAVVPPWEDAVTLAVNAARTVLTDDDRREVELVIAATESAPDLGKPLSSWVHRHCGLPADCAGFEAKGACYAGVAALEAAALWVRAGLRPGKKALVVCADLTHRSDEGTVHAGGGGCGVAMLVSADPKVLELEPERAGYWCSEVADVFRPTMRDEVTDAELSLYAYLDALDGAYECFARRAGEVDYLADFARHVYHAPVPGMTLLAHRAMLERAGVTDEARVREHFEATVRPGLRLGARIGTAYGASNFVSLLGHLTDPRGPAAGDRLSFFAYGSGSQGEFYSARVGLDAAARARSLGLDAALASRRPVTVDDFDRVERARDACDGRADFTVDRDVVPGAYEEQYAGRGLLVLEGAKGFRRRYAWS